MNEYESNRLTLECGHDLVYLWNKAVGSYGTFQTVTCPICITTVSVLRCDDPTERPEE